MRGDRSSREVPTARAVERARSGVIDALVAALTGAVLMARLLTPTEGAVLGVTLWIAQLALLAWLLAIIADYRNGSGWTCDWVDGAVGLLVAAHAIGAWLNWHDLDKRAACNVVCEWCGLLATWFLLRRALADFRGRRRVVLMHLAAGTALAGLGIWQYEVEIPHTQQEIERQERNWDRLHQRGRPGDPREALEWDRAVREAQLDRVRLGLPADDEARQLWEGRAKASREPYGFFALANTLGGVLLCTLVLGLGVALAGWRTGQSAGRLALAAALWMMVALCLLLTKSRTAFAGLVVGLAAVAVTEGARTTRRRIVAWGVGAAALALGLGTVAALIGGLDRLVWSESFKSLQYRMEYWSGTWRMMTAGGWRWLTGVGPGNFRPHYLEFKLPESSEEVADPHNLLLDVWANAGLLGAIGLVLLFYAVLRPLLRTMGMPGQASTGTRAGGGTNIGLRQSRIDLLLVGAGLGFGVVYLLDGATDNRLLPVGLGWVTALALWSFMLPGELPLTVASATALGLGVHLLGAGGIEMPAIVQWILFLSAWTTTAQPPSAGRWQFAGRGAVALIGSLVCGLYLACWWWGLWPDLSAKAHLAAGDAAVTEERRVDRAEREYRAAAESDPFGHEAYDRLAALTLQKWEQNAEAADDVFDRAIDWWRRSLRAFPRNLEAWRAIGTAHLARFESSHDSRDARLAADALVEAANLYPHSPRLQAACARALWHAGELRVAQAFAERALALHDLNQERGHRDKLLPAGQLELMRKILAAGADDAN